MYCMSKILDLVQASQKLAVLLIQVCNEFEAYWELMVLIALCNVFPIYYFNSFFKNTFAMIKITIQI